MISDFGSSKGIDLLLLFTILVILQQVQVDTPQGIAYTGKRMDASSVCMGLVIMLFIRLVRINIELASLLLYCSILKL